MNLFKTVLNSLAVLVIPPILLLLAARVVMSPLFLQLEYSMPYFPPDTFGLTQEDRLYYARFTLDYLFNDAGIEYLAELTFPDGSPLFNERELDHMIDVKEVIQLMQRVLPVLALGLVAIGLIAWRGGWMSEFWQSTSYGGWLTVGLIAAILFTVALSFRSLFTVFHRVLGFEGDTWLFSYSDSLIRLLPMTLWRDGFILVGLLTAAAGALLGWRARRWSIEAEQQPS